MSSRADLLLHPVRLRIVEALYGRELTPKGIHEALGDIPIATLYRHIDRLLENQILEVVAERQRRGGVERTLALADSGRLGPQDFTTIGALGEGFRAAIGALLAQANRYFDAAADRDVETERPGIHQIPVWMSDDELDDFSQRLIALLDEALERPETPDRRRRTFTITQLPEP